MYRMYSHDINLHSVSDRLLVVYRVSGTSNRVYSIQKSARFVTPVELKFPYTCAFGGIRPRKVLIRALPSNAHVHGNLNSTDLLLTVGRLHQLMNSNLVIVYGDHQRILVAVDSL